MTTTTPTNTLPAARRPVTVEDHEYFVRLHLKGLQMKMASPEAFELFKRGAAKAVADLDAARAAKQ